MYKKVVFIFFPLIFFSQISFSQLSDQGFYTISGYVLSSENGSYLPFVSVGILNHPQSTVTNSQGFFEINISKRNLEDTIAVIAESYRVFKIAVRSAVNNENLNISLSPIAEEIEEITIVGFTPYELVLKGLENVNLNYSKSSYVSEAFYREIITENTECTRLLEAALKILEPGYKKFRNRKSNQILNVHKLRRFQDSRNFRNYEWDGLQYIMNENIFGQNPVGILNAYGLDDWDFDHTKTTKIQNEVAYVIEFKGKDENKSRPNGKIYIAAEDFAILHLSWNLNNSIHNWHHTILPDDKFLKYTNWEMTFSYKRVKSKLYLNYVYHKRNFDRYDPENEDDKTEIEIYNELIVNNISKQNLLELFRNKTYDHEKAFNKPQYKNEKYWNKYNIPAADSILIQYYNDLESKE